MIDNYHIHPAYGVLTQRERQPFTYDEKYVEAYDKLKCDDMSRLRFWKIVSVLGFMPGSILDIGYGNGAFLRYAREQGVKIAGFDVHPHPGLEEYRIRSISDGSYDVITFFDVLEHVDDIGKEIDSLAAHRYLVVSMPCWHSDKTGEWFESWKHRKPNEHLWHFSPLSLKTFMGTKGYSMLYIGNPEDEIRKGTEPGRWNIITGIFKKM